MAALVAAARSPAPFGHGFDSPAPGLVSSAAGTLACLADDEVELKVYALKTLNIFADTWWTEIAGSLSQMYVFRRDSPFGLPRCTLRLLTYT